MLKRDLEIFLSWGSLEVSPFEVEHIFVFLQLELSHQAKCYLEIYALDIVSVLLQ